MIEYECDHGDASIKANGSITEIAADVTLLFYILKNKLNKKAQADLYDYLQVGMLQVFEPDIFKAGDLSTGTKEMLKKTWKDNPDMLSNLVKEIREVLEDESES